MKSLCKVFSLAILSMVLLFTACKPEEKKIDPPSSLDYSIDENDVVTLKWKGNTDSYDVRVEQDGKLKEAKEGIKGTSVAIEGLEGGDYTWKVRGVSGGDATAWISGKTFTIEGASATLPQVQTLSVEEITPYSSILVFQRLSDDVAEGYQYEVEIDGEKKIIDVMQKPYSDFSDVTVYTSKKLTPGKTYVWRVKTIKGSETSKTATKVFETYSDPLPATGKKYQYVLVTFKKGDRTDIWGVDERSKQENVGNVQKRNYIVAENSGILDILSFRKAGGWNIPYDNMYPLKQFAIKFPVEKGTFSSLSKNTYPYFDYVDSIGLKVQDIVPGADEKRVGDYITYNTGASHGSVVIKDVTAGAGENTYFVEGTYTAKLLDPIKNDYVDVEAEFYMGIDPAQ